MQRQRPSPVALCVFAVVTWALPHVARACTCMPLPPPAVAVEQAEAVFEARVEGVQGATDPAGPGMVRYELLVSRVFKGEVTVNAQLVTRASSAACGRSLVVGRRYLIYAARDRNGDLTDSLCSRTRQTSAADEDLVVLGAGVAPGTPAAPVSDENREPPRIEAPPSPPLGPSPAAGRCQLGGAGGLGGLALLLARRRRRR